MSSTPEAHYRTRQTTLLTQQKSIEASASRTRLILLASAGLAILFGISALQKTLPPWTIALPTLVAAALLPSYLKKNRQIYDLSRQLEYCDAGLARTLGTETQSGHTGDAFHEDGHLYDRDLNILGPDSLFGMLCTVRTELGQRRLAHDLLHIPDRDETLRRQQAIQELAPLTSLRERLALLGSFSVLQISANLFDNWLDEPLARISRAVSLILFTTTAIFLLLLISGAANLVAWSTLTPYIVVVLVVQGLVALSVRNRVLPVLERTIRLSVPNTILRQGLALLSEQTFTSTKLRDLQNEAAITSRSVQHLNKLQIILTLIDQRPKEWYFVPALLLCVGTQSVIAIEQWKLRHGPDMRRWLAAWAEFESLNALATYAFEHPNDIYPEILPPGTASFETSQLGHPLLTTTAVRNDITLNLNTRFYLISGSNMAGKSTLLRAIGTNAILAALGAPIRATAARISSLQICASIALVDSLAESKSKFLAEAERLQITLASSAANSPTGKPVLFLIDEIFSGTNSHDRRTAAEAILSALIRNGAIGALSTHDLTLTEIAVDPTLHGLNVHMASPDPDDPLAFDYKLNPGVNTSSNAIAILRLLGI
jgi:DNA mismatch repair ATPase MutS